MVIRLSGSAPYYRQIYQALRRAILTGSLRHGDRLPVTRVLADELGVSRNVVVIAYELLAAEGYTSGRTGSGTYVAAAVPDSMIQPARPQPKPAAAPQPAPRLSRYAARILDTDIPPADGHAAPRCRFDFAYFLASPDDFPAAVWRRLLMRSLRSVDLEYSPVRGDARLRTEIAHYLRRSRAIACREDQVLLVNGSQQALDLVARVLLNPGDTVAIEDPHYQGARQAFRSVGARLLPIPVDGAGLKVESLPRARRVPLVYVTPSHQFPTGGVMPVTRRLKLLAWAQRRAAYILEDDYDGEYHYEGRPVEAVQALDRTGRVIYVGTFSRILFPSLRLGYVVMPEALADPLAKAKWISDRQTSSVQQAALAEFMRKGYLEALVRRVRKRNVARRQALLDSLQSSFGAAIEIQGAAAGSHVLVRFPGVPAARAPALIAAAARAGVRVYPAAGYYLNPPPQCELILGYGRMREREIPAAVRALAGALAPYSR